MIIDDKNIVPSQSNLKESIPLESNETKKLGHVMLDLETMGKSSNSVICSIGAVEFDIETGDLGREFYTGVDIQSCLDNGLIVNGSTIEWWLMQNEKARKSIAMGERMALGLALHKFSNFVQTIGGKQLQIWGNSPRFDLGILEDAFIAVGFTDIPWDFRLERDVRTLVSFAPKIKEHYPSLGTQHHPIDDCKYQIGYCSAIWQNLNPV